MEKLTVLELLLLSSALSYSSQASGSERFKFIHEAIGKKLYEEIKTRDSGEIRAGFLDLQRIDPAFKPDVDRSLLIMELADRLKRQNR